MSDITTESVSRLTLSSRVITGIPAYIHLSGDSNIGDLTLSGSMSVGSGKESFGSNARCCLVIGDTQMKADGDEAVAIGYKATATGNQAISMGSNTNALCAYSIAFGEYTNATGKWAFAQGHSTNATNDSAHAEGFETTASGIQSHAEGKWTTAAGANSYAGGFRTRAYGDTAYAIGHQSSTSASYSFIWSGISSQAYEISSSENYAEDRSRDGTFNINPMNGIRGVYIAHQDLSTIITGIVNRILEDRGL